MSVPSVRPPSTWFKPTAVGGLVIVITSILVSAVAYSALASTVRIRWGVGYHYGPEHAPAIVILAAFPVLLAMLFVGVRWLGSRLDRFDESEDLQLVYELSGLAVFVLVLAVQIALIGLNIYL